MRTGPELLAATKRFAQENVFRSLWSILSTVSILFIVAAGALWETHIGIQLGFSVLMGLVGLRLFVIYHDQQHHALLPQSKALGAFMRVFGLLALSPSCIWRSSHSHHHSHNSKLRGSQIGSFPIMTRDQFQNAPKRIQRRYLISRHPLTILFGYWSMFLFGMCIRPFANKPRKNAECLIALLTHIAIGVALFWIGGWRALLFGQTVPHFILYAIGAYFFYAQHNFPGVTFRDKSNWTHVNAALESSSYMKMGPLMRWFSANIGYHHIHHLNSNIPFYRLPEAYRELPELQDARETSLNPVEIYRCLRLKLWDVQANRMIGLSELQPK